MTDAIFLSASVPDPKRGPEFAASADAVAISAAVSALVHVALGRRLLVWGGHPAITPMIGVVAKDIGVEYSRWLQLYQSNYFHDEFPEDNMQFGNVTYTEAIDNNRNKSLQTMRERMFSDREFKAAVFIGGMVGIIEEFDLFKKLQPNAVLVPVFSTGGAVLRLADRIAQYPADLADDLEYVGLFHRHLNISVREQRFRTPDEQPEVIEKRFWRPTQRR